VGATTPVEKEHIDKGIQKEIIRLKVQVSNTIPNNVQEALELDKENYNTIWLDKSKEIGEHGDVGRR